MLMVMEMATGKILEDEFGAFEDEVLNAGWVPPGPELQLGLQEVHTEHQDTSELDADTFLSTIYRIQR